MAIISIDRNIKLFGMSLNHLTMQQGCYPVMDPIYPVTGGSLFLRVLALALASGHSDAIEKAARHVPDINGVPRAVALCMVGGTDS